MGQWYTFQLPFNLVERRDNCQDKLKSVLKISALKVWNLNNFGEQFIVFLRQLSCLQESSHNNNQSHRFYLVFQFTAINQFRANRHQQETNCSRRIKRRFEVAVERQILQVKPSLFIVCLVYCWTSLSLSRDQVESRTEFKLFSNYNLNRVKCGLSLSISSSSAWALENYTRRATDDGSIISKFQNISHCCLPLILPSLLLLLLPPISKWLEMK